MISRFAAWSWMTAIAGGCAASMVTNNLLWFPAAVGLWVVFVLAYAATRAAVEVWIERKESR